MPLPPTAHTPEPEESLLQSGTGTPSEPHYQTRTTSSPFPAEPGAPSHLGSALRAEAADRTIHQSAQLTHAGVPLELLAEGPGVGISPAWMKSFRSSIL